MSEFEAVYPIINHMGAYQDLLFTLDRSVVPPRTLNQRQKRLRDRRIGHNRLRRKKGGKR